MQTNGWIAGDIVGDAVNDVASKDVEVDGCHGAPSPIAACARRFARSRC
jgi:hypothetical protein